MIRKLSQFLFGRNLDSRERIFRVIVLVGFIAAFAGTLECVVLMEVGPIMVPLLLLLLAMSVSMVATFKYRKIELASILVGVLIIMVVFPEMFLLSGGLEGGATVWFVLGIFYVFLMFSGKKMIVLLIATFGVDVAVYATGYYYPFYVKPMESRAASYMDSLFAVLVVGLAVGIVLKFQMKIYEIERGVAERQKEELEKANNAQNSFFASMSHEIRTPINTIIGLNEMILRENWDNNTREYAANIQVASKMLLSLVNDILDLSRMEMKRMEIIPVEYWLRDWCQELVDIMLVRAGEKELTFQIDLDPNLPSILYGDEKRIKQVMLNLLTNAVKYTRVGTVSLSVSGEMTAQDRVTLRLSVTDTGIGIRKEDLKYLYDAFRRIDERDNIKVEGSGLGLSICKQLVDLMGGEITVDSIYTKGSVFTVTLEQQVLDPSPVGVVQFMERERREGETRYRQSFEAPEARVLVVDDNEMNRMVIRKLLEATKVQLDVAASGEEALQKTLNKYYHVILMDYMMGDKNGAETLELIRRQENGLCRDSAVIVLTANTLAEAKKICQEHDFDGYLEKPIQSDRLEAEIQKFLPEDILEYQSGANTTVGAETELQRATRKKRKKVCITTDCTSDIPDEFLEMYDIRVMYLYIETDRGRFADTREIDSDSLAQYLLEGEGHVFASNVSVEEYEQFFADVLTQAEDVIHIAMAANVGKSFGMVAKAASGFDHVHVIDSGHISGGAGLVTLYAARMAQRGCKTEEICAEVERIKGQVCSKYFMPTTDIFYQNGHTDALSNRVCSLFRLHPVLGMRQSRIVIVGTHFGNIENAWKRFIRWHLLRKRHINPEIVLISHVSCTVRQLDLIRREVERQIPFAKVIVQKASFSNACNVGVGTIGISYYRKSNR